MLSNHSTYPDGDWGLPALIALTPEPPAGTTQHLQQPVPWSQLQLIDLAYDNGSSPFIAN